MGIKRFTFTVLEIPLQKTQKEWNKIPHLKKKNLIQECFEYFTIYMNILFFVSFDNDKESSVINSKHSNKFNLHSLISR